MAGNYVINVDEESRELLQVLSTTSDKSMKVVVREALVLYSQVLTGKVEPGVLALLVMFRDEVNKRTDEILTAVVKEQSHKPWLGREDADDIKEISHDEMYPDGSAGVDDADVEKPKSLRGSPNERDPDEREPR